MFSLKESDSLIGFQGQLKGRLRPHEHRKKAASKGLGIMGKETAAVKGYRQLHGGEGRRGRGARDIAQWTVPAWEG